MSILNDAYSYRRQHMKPHEEQIMADLMKEQAIAAGHEPRLPVSEYWRLDLYARSAATAKYRRNARTQYEASLRLHEQEKEAREERKAKVRRRLLDGRT